MLPEFDQFLEKQLFYDIKMEYGECCRDLTNYVTANRSQATSRRRRRTTRHVPPYQPPTRKLIQNVILDLCKRVQCVDLGESFQTHIYLQNLASIQPRTSPVMSR